MTQSRSLSRRTFVRLAAGTTAFAALGLFGCAAPRTTVSSTPSQTVTCDVLVVGAGAAGTSAALQAASTGAHTILIDKAAWQSGSSSLAIGTLYGAGTQLQKAQGIDDTPDALLAYFMTRGGDKLDPAMQKFCAEHFGETIDWLQTLGVPFKEEVSLKGSDTVPRGHNIDDRDEVALAAVTQAAKNAGVQFVFNTEADSLIVGDDGTVEGVMALEGHRNLIEYQAKRTILATGGFCRNDEMIAEYCPDYKGVYTEVGPGCTGEGLQMGLDIGAAYLGHGGTNGILACPVEAGQSKLIDKKALWVNSDGKRFVNEDGQTHDVYYTVAHFPDQAFYAVYDQAMVDALDDKLAAAFQMGLDKGYFAKGDTVAEAADKLKVDGAAAQKQLEAYNALAKAGNDTEYGKKAGNLVVLDKAPYYVLTMGVCTHGSFGGYHVNTDFEVLDEEEQVIPGLYAVGEVSCGSFIYDDYPAGGCGLNYAYTSGRFAGQNAAEAMQA